MIARKAPGLLAGLLVSLWMAAAGEAQEAAGSACAPPDGLAEALADPRATFLLFGEMHGTVETPALFGEIVCAVAADGRRVLVGVERLQDEQPAFDAYLSSSGAPDDIDRFLGQAGWRDTARDGRASEATLALLERLRGLRTSGAEVTVVAFDPGSGTPPDANARDRGMAEALQEAAAAADAEITLALTGNLHPRKEELAFGGGMSPMALHLPPERTLSIDVRPGGGEAWICTRSGCGARPMGGTPALDPPRIELFAAPESGYDGVIRLGPTSAAPPAASSE